MYLKKTKKSNRLYHIIQRQLETTLMLKTYIFVCIDDIYVSAQFR